MTIVGGGKPLGRLDSEEFYVKCSAAKIEPKKY